MNRVLSYIWTTAKWKCGRGQALVETAIAIVVFLVVVFGILDFGRLLFTQLTLQHVMREAGRFAVTGRHDYDPSNSGLTTTRTNAIFQVAQQAAVGVPLTGYEISSVAGGAGSAGGPGDTVTISLSRDLRLLTPLGPLLGHFFHLTNYMNSGVYRITVSATFKNEPFPPSQTN